MKVQKRKCRIHRDRIGPPNVRLASGLLDDLPFNPWLSFTAAPLRRGLVKKQVEYIREVSNS
jgi:hypothetical protein